MTLLVLGWANRVYGLRRRQPLPGETVLGGELRVATGGKGANQAVAAARAGASPVFIGAVGDDSVGAEILAELSRRGVDTAHTPRSAQQLALR